MKKHKAWVWFKGGLDGGSWVGGFMASEVEGEDETFLIERADFITCKVPNWRITLIEPKDQKSPPLIPNEAKWKY